MTSVARELFNDDTIVFSNTTSAQKETVRWEKSHR